MDEGKGEILSIGVGVNGRMKHKRFRLVLAVVLVLLVIPLVVIGVRALLGAFLTLLVRPFFDFALFIWLIMAL